MIQYIDSIGNAIKIAELDTHCKQIQTLANKHSDVGFKYSKSVHESNNWVDNWNSCCCSVMGYICGAAERGERGRGARGLCLAKQCQMNQNQFKVGQRQLRNAVK